MAEEKKTANDLIKMLENFFKQLPKLPNNVTDILVQLAPWLSLIFGVFGIITGLGALGLSPLALLGGIDASFMVLATGIVSIVARVIMLLAYPKLVKRQYKGWELLFWSEIISAISAIIMLYVGAVLGILIGLYLLFQIKSYYK